MKEREKYFDYLETKNVLGELQHSSTKETFILADVIININIKQWLYGEIARRVRELSFTTGKPKQVQFSKVNRKSRYSWTPFVDKT